MLNPENKPADYGAAVLVEVADNHTLLGQAQAIRKVVFVDEQQVPAEEEIDAYEHEATHFIAFDEHRQPCGAARWRFTEKGIKLERFAVLASHRRRGIGAMLVQAVLSNVSAHPRSHGKVIYLHSQLSAMPMYEKFGFERKGDMFLECDIRHFCMEKKQ